MFILKLSGIHTDVIIICKLQSRYLQKRFYTRGTLRSIKNSRLNKIKNPLSGLVEILKVRKGLII